MKDVGPLIRGAGPLGPLMREASLLMREAGPLIRDVGPLMRGAGPLGPLMRDVLMREAGPLMRDVGPLMREAGPLMKEALMSEMGIL